MRLPLRPHIQSGPELGVRVRSTNPAVSGNPGASCRSFPRPSAAVHGSEIKCNEVPFAGKPARPLHCPDSDQEIQGGLRRREFLAPRAKKNVQQGFRGSCAYSAVHVRPVMALGMAEDPRAVLDSARLRIFRAKVQPRNSAERNSPRAHGARFERHVHARTVKTVRADLIGKPGELPVFRRARSRR